MIYFLMVPLVFINLFIAIILQGFETTSQKVNDLISEGDLDKFKDCWAEFDPNGTGFMRLSDMPALMLNLGEPLGWRREIYENNVSLQDDFLEELNIMTYNQFKDVLFWEVIQALTKIFLIRLNMRNKKIFEHKQDMENQGVIPDDPDDAGDSFMANLDNDDPFAQQKEEKLQLRLELEFERIEDER